MRRSSLALLSALCFGGPAAAQVAASDAHLTLAEARTSPRCNGTQWASKIAELRAADPERDADQRTGAGDFSVKGTFHTLPEDASDAPALTGRVLMTYVTTQSDRRVRMMTYAFNYSDVVCSPYPTEWIFAPPVPAQEAATGWCAEAVEVLAGDYTGRFNRRVLAHRQYPYKDICAPASAPNRSESDQPPAEQIPQQIPDIVTAARFGLVEHAKRFIAEKSDLLRKDIFGYDALQWSVVRHYPALFDLLLASDADYDFCHGLGAAVRFRRDEMVPALTRRCPSAQERLGLLRQAAEQQNLDTLRALLDIEPALKLERDAAGAAALEMAIAKSNVEVARMLLDRGADPNAPQRGWSERTLLAKAIALRNAPLAELLLDRGADVTAPVELNGSHFSTPGPLHFAVERNAREVVVALARRGVDLNAAVPLKAAVAATPIGVDPLGRQTTSRASPGEPHMRRFADPPIFLAIDPLMNSSMVELLLQLGADPNVHDAEGRTPLIVAIANSQIFGKRGGAGWIERYVPQKLIRGQEDWEHRGIEAVRILLDGGARPAFADTNGLTALHHAARSDYNVEIARMLLSHGAEPNARDAAGKTALDHAREAGLERMPEMLVAAGARSGT